MRQPWGGKLLEAAESPLLPPLDWTRRDVDLPNLAGKALVVRGVRGAGVSSILRQFLVSRQNEGRPRTSLLYVDLDDDRLEDPTVADLQALLEAHAERYPPLHPGQGRLLVLDGVTRVAGWEAFVEERIRHEPGLRAIVADSSADLGEGLGEGVARLRLRPFSFREFLRRRWAEPTRPWAELDVAERRFLHEHLRQYLREGGFPTVQGQLEAETRARLRQLVDVLLLRDVVDRHRVSNPTALRRLQRRLLRNPGQGFSVQSFLGELKESGLRVAKDTLHADLDHLEDAGLVETVALHTDSERQRRVHPRRIYPADPGLVGLFAPGPGQAAAALRTAVYHELRRRGCELGYLRLRDADGNEHEVDFHAHTRGRETLLVQVSNEDPENPTARRQQEALDHAAEVFAGARCITVTLDDASLAEVGPRRWPAAAWLLGESRTSD